MAVGIDDGGDADTLLLYVDSLPAGPFDFTFTATLTCDGCEEPWVQEFRVYSVAQGASELPLIEEYYNDYYLCFRGDYVYIPLPQFADPDTAAAEGWYISYTYPTNFYAEEDQGYLCLAPDDIGTYEVYFYLCNGQTGYSELLATVTLDVTESAGGEIG